MTSRKQLLILLLLTSCCLSVWSQSFSVSGRVSNAKDNTPVEFATILLKDSRLWAVTDSKGQFAIHNVPQGRETMTVSCLGFATYNLNFNINKDITNLRIQLREDNLSLDEVQVVARRKDNESTTAYTIDRKTLDNQQIINLADISSLLPGGKVTNPSLMSDSRLALRAGSSEAGNAAFGTAIDVDGVRLSNNAAVGETRSASTRGISASNIESVEVITGIPSVEYGDLSNGIVKVNTRKGASPFIVEGSVNQHTRQIAVNKGLSLGQHAGVLNFSLEHARSFSDAASPHTAYQRNALSLNYMNVWMRQTRPLTLNIGFRGNIGGYNADSDPDNDLDDYAKVRDNQYSGHFSLQWQPNLAWVTQLQLTGSISATDRLATSYYNTSSASTQPYIHAMTQGYHIAEDYDANPNADIILGPTGYWYVKQFTGNKPLSASLKLKYEWVREVKRVTNALKLGAQYSYDHNNGRGTYYDDMRYAPTWRRYEYSDLPAMNNVGLYAEDMLTIATSRHQSLQLTLGLRDDITTISGSDYGTASSLSPRLNAKYTFLRRGKGFVRGFNVYAGWGKSVKLPSFEVLYPSPAYSDRLAFSSTSDENNRSYYAYYTFPTKAIYNKDLKWQSARQVDVGMELQTKIATVSVSAFYTKTVDPYMATSVFTPYTYYYTPPSAVQGLSIAAADRAFTIDKNGTVTVSDRAGNLSPVTLQSQQRNTYVTNTEYVNASPTYRWGLEWIIDFRQIRPLRTQIRLDGNYYHYKSLDATLFADVPLGINSRMSDGRPYQYIGYYSGANATSTSYDASASVTNGAISKNANLNVTFTTHIPRLRMIMALRVETSLYTWRRAMSQYKDGSSRGYALEEGSNLFGEPYDGKTEDQTVIVYPEYYSTWENPAERLPYLERLRWAQENDRNLYNDLAQLAVRSNYSYVLNPNKLSAYYSANFSITKEIGDHISISFYANNFFNNMHKVHSSQTDLDTVLFGSSYIPNFYYGLSLRLKI